MSDVLDVLTLDEAKQAINMQASSYLNDEQIELWITAVSRRMDRLVGAIVQRSVTETVDAYGRSIYPNVTPVASVTTVTEYIGGSGTVLTLADPDTSGTYRLRDDRIERRSGFAAYTFNGEVMITYVAGRFTSTDTVDELYKACAGAMLRRIWAREAGAWARGGDPFTDVGVGGFFQVIDPVVREFLADELLPPAVA